MIDTCGNITSFTTLTCASTGGRYSEGIGFLEKRSSRTRWMALRVIRGDPLDFASRSCLEENFPRTVVSLIEDESLSLSRAEDGLSSFVFTEESREKRPATE